MATTATPWSGEQSHKLFLQSGQFTSTIKDSEDVSSLAPSLAIGICWDGVDTPWSSDYANKLYLQSGQFTSTLKTSQDINSVDTGITDISADDNNTPWIGSEADKLYLTSGQFTSTLKDSELVVSVEVWTHGISYDGINTPWTGHDGDKLYLQSGQFTSTLKTSYNVNSIDTDPTAISWDGTNTPWAGAEADKLYLQSGQFTSTLKTSQDVSAVDNIVVGISTDDYHARTTALIQSIIDSLSIGDSVGEEIIRVPFPIQNITDTLIIADGVLGILDSIDIVDNLIIVDEVEVLFNVITITDNLVISDLVYLPITYDMDVVDNIPISDTIAFSHNLYEVTDNLVIVQYIDLNDEIERSTSNNFIVTHSAVAEIDSYAPIVIDTLLISDSIEIWRPQPVKLDNGILFSQIVHLGMKYTDDIESGFVDERLIWNPETGIFELLTYGLRHDVESQLIGNRSIAQDLNLSHDVEYLYISVSAIAKSLSNTLSLGQTVTISRGLDNTLNLGQTVAISTCYHLSNTLNLAQSITPVKILKLTFIQTFAVKSTFTHTFNATEILCKYSPFVGATTDAGAPTPPNVTPPTIVPIDEITLSCPSKSTSITLRNPNIGDRNNLQYQRINRETRGGILIIFADTTWPRIEKLILEFSGLSESKAQDLLTFLNTSLGLTVELTDWESNTWSGIITKPQNPIIRGGRDCGISASIEFEGVPT